MAAIGKQLERDINDWGAWAAKADILCSLGMHSIAILCCDRSLMLNPDNALAWFTKGIALSKLGRTVEADAAFTRAKELGF
ncbi:MAG: tetratricopeptide repeat protein [Methanotrichaceae archaeon]